MVFEEGLTRSYTSFETVDWVEFTKNVEKLPEDYVFILSPEEWNQWLELYLGLAKTLKAAGNPSKAMGKLTDFAKENKSNPLTVICLLSARPKIGNAYKVGSVMQAALGDCCAIYFAKVGQETTRGDEVRRAVINFRHEQAQRPPLS